MKTILKQFFPVVLFIMLYKVVLTFESVDKILKCMKAILKQYFPVVLFVTRYMVAQTFESVDKIQKLYFFFNFKIRKF